MEALIILIVISFVVALGFLIAFWRSVGNGQFDDLVTPSVDILHEDQQESKQWAEGAENDIKHGAESGTVSGAEHGTPKDLLQAPSKVRIL